MRFALFAWTLALSVPQSENPALAGFDAAGSDPRATRFRIPRRGWTKMGSILLSTNRGERQHENLAVLRDVPPSVFTSPRPVDPMQYADSG